MRSSAYRPREVCARRGLVENPKRLGADFGYVHGVGPLKELLTDDERLRKVMSGGLTRSPELGHENELLSKKADDRDGALGRAMPESAPDVHQPRHADCARIHH